MQTMPDTGCLIRQAVPDDAASLADILNGIIALGSLTALKMPVTPVEFSRMYLEGEHVFGCSVAEDRETGMLLGYQTLVRHPDLPADWGDIGTFTRPEPRRPGLGTALFAETRARALEHGLVAINAAIRADNAGGLAYYERMGFRTHRVVKDVPMQDGTPVDRIHKRHVLTWAAP